MSESVDVLSGHKVTDTDSLAWNRITPEPGERTTALINQEPKIGRLKPIAIFEHLAPGSEVGIVCIPGGLDIKTDDDTKKMGAEMHMSTFHIKYPSDSSFSIRREVAQILDHVESRGIERLNIVTGSWGGIPTLNAAYNLIRRIRLSWNLYLWLPLRCNPAI